MNLSLLSILLGVGLCVPQIYGLANPQGFAAAAKKFPRNVPLGVVLMLLATAWFVFNVNQEADADFAAMKPVLMTLFIAVGVATCIFVQDFLAARGLAVVLLLLARLMVETARWPEPDTRWRWVISGWAYGLVAAGIWFTVAPWRLRDVLEWNTANVQRIKIGCGLRLAFGLFVAGLGFTVFRG